MGCSRGCLKITLRAVPKPLDTLALRNLNPWNSICRLPFSLGPLAILALALWKRQRALANKPRWRRVLCRTDDLPFEHLGGSTSEHPFHREVEEVLRCHPTLSVSRPQYNRAPPPLDAPGSWEWVDTVRGLRAAIAHLRQSREIGVDVEHHAHRSYWGFVCLIQLSDGVKDFLIDAIKLHDSVHELNGLLSDPGILKVVHGGGACSFGWRRRCACPVGAADRPVPPQTTMSRGSRGTFTSTW